VAAAAEVVEATVAEIINRQSTYSIQIPSATKGFFYAQF